MRRLFLLALTAATLIPAGVRAQATYVYTDLGDLPLENQNVKGVVGNVTKSVLQTDAYGISPTGVVTGDVYISASNISSSNVRGTSITDQREFTYFSGKTHSVGTVVGGNNSVGYGINTAGQIALTSDSAASAGVQGELYYGGIFHKTGSSSVSGGQSYALAVNEVGHVTGNAEEQINISGTSSLITEKAMIWKGGQPIFLKDLSISNNNSGIQASSGQAINSSDQVAGWSYVIVSGITTIHGCILLGANVQAIDVGTLAGPSDPSAISYCYGIDNAGDVCGVSTLTTNFEHAFLFTGGKGGVMTDLGVLSLSGGRNTIALGMNNVGTIVGEADQSNGNADVAVVWPAGIIIGGNNTPVDLNTVTTGAGQWVMEVAYAVNDSGQIVGNAINTGTGGFHGFLLTPTALATPPTVTQNPINFQALVGQNVTIASNISGSPISGTKPMNFQWFDNGVAISGATNSTLALNNIQLSSTGNYSVVATNLVGTVTTNAIMTVIQAATINIQPSAAGALAGRSATFRVGAAGSGTLSYEWQSSADNITWTDVPNSTPFSGVTSSALTINPTTLEMNQLLFRCIVNNIAGIPATTTPAVLAVGVPPGITLPPDPLVINQGNNANLTVTAVGTPPVSVQWSHTGAVLLGANTTAVGNNSLVTVTSILPLTNAQTPTAGNYMVQVSNPLGSATATTNTTVILLPNLTKQPASVGVIEGKNVSFAVTATGTPTLTYQWQSSPDGNNPWTNLDNDNTFKGTTSTTLSVTNVTLAMNGTQFRCVVNNPSNVAVPSNAATLTVGVPPTITARPLTQAVNQNSSPVLSVSASGTAPLSYQWDFGGKPILGATGITYTITNVQPTNAGNYSVVVSNAVGNVSASANVSVIILPTITSQPANSAVIANKATSFKVTATGSPTLTYQWQSSPDGSTWTNVVNGSPFNGNNTTTLSISNATLAMNGTHFQVIVNNPSGVANVSTTALLTTGAVPTIATAPDGVGKQTVNQNASITLSVNPSGTAPFSYIWKHGSAVLGSVTNSLTIPSPQAADAGAYSVLVANPFGNVTSTGNLTVIILPAIGIQPIPSTVIAGKATSFKITATGTPTLTYQWQSSPDGSTWTNVVNGSPFNGNNTTTLSISNATLAMNGTQFRAIVNNGANPPAPATSGPALLTTGAVPTIAVPATDAVGNHTVNQNASITLSVNPSGTAPFTYVWKHGTAVLSGQTSSSLTIASPQAADAGAYSVLVANPFGNVTSTGNLTVILLPTITNQPANSTVIAGKATAFKVTATGTPTLTYQWQQSTNGGSSFSNLTNGGGFSGVTTANLAISNATLAMNGTQYQVIVNNPSNVANISTPALLSTGVIPTITAAPGNQTINQGTGTSFTVVATGTGPLSYQWSLGNSSIPGGTSATLPITNAQSTDAGKYIVAVANPYGQATASANLTVINLPAIATNPVDQTIIAGKSASFKVTATGTPTLTYQWQSSPDGTSWSNLTNGGGFSGVTTANLSITSTTLVMNATHYRAVVNNGASPPAPATSDPALLNVGNPPTITGLSPSGNQTVNQNSSVSITVGLGVNSTTPLTYAWSVNGATLGAQTTGTLSIPSAQGTDAGKYSLLVSNAWGNATISTNLTVIILPVINSGGQPASFAAAVGKSTSFSVSAGGSGPLTYQWQVSTDGGTTFNNILSNDATLKGATTAKLTVGTTTFAMNGWKFKVIINNASGVPIISDVATLTVGNPPVIDSPPTNKTVTSGSGVSFSVLATGDPTLTYQWFLGATPLTNNGTVAGATTANLTLTNVSSANAGNYFVTVTNAYGNASGQAMLTVTSIALKSALLSSSSSGSSSADTAGGSSSSGLSGSNVSEPDGGTFTSGDLVSVIIVPGETLTPADVSVELLTAMNLSATADVSLLPSVSMAESSGVNYTVLQFRQARTVAGQALTVQYGYATGSNVPATWLNIPSSAVTQLPNADANTSVYQIRIPVPQGQGAYFRISTAE